MKRLGLLLVVLLAPGLLGADEQKAPKISVEPPSFDFGSVVAGSTVEKEFFVRNFGSEDLAIAQIVPSCGCTVIDSNYQKTIKPGGSGSFRLSLHLPTTAGHLVKSVVVKSNDPAKASLEVKLEATVVTQAR
jgi:hypothetical protein